jgi:hypothetical protein
MVHALKKTTVTSLLLTIGIFYFSFMVLDRVLSIIYGFNFQPYGPYMPPGFTIWGHIFNGSMAALGLFLTFKLFDYGGNRRMWFLQVLALGIFLAVGALIPFMNDAEHLTKNGQAATIPIYVIANDLYVFFWGVLTYRMARSIKAKAVVLSVLFFVFLIVHFVFYAPMFPEFYWS